MFKSKNILPLNLCSIFDEAPCVTFADFLIYRGAFDISLIASIASHLTYWADEDVNHFMISQLLSRKSRD